MRRLEPISGLDSIGTKAITLRHIVPSNQGLIENERGGLLIGQVFTDERNFPAAIAVTQRKAQ